MAKFHQNELSMFLNFSLQFHNTLPISMVKSSYPLQVWSALKWMKMLLLKSSHFQQILKCDVILMSLITSGISHCDVTLRPIVLMAPEQFSLTAHHRLVYQSLLLLIHGGIENDHWCVAGCHGWSWDTPQHLCVGPWWQQAATQQLDTLRRWRVPQPSTPASNTYVYILTLQVSWNFTRCYESLRKLSSKQFIGKYHPNNNKIIFEIIDKKCNCIEENAIWYI